MSKTKKISISVKKGNEDFIDLLDTYANHHRVSRSDFMFRCFNHFHETQTELYRSNDKLILLQRNRMNKTIKISNIAYETLVVIAKKQNKKTDDYVEQLIQEHYNKTRK